METQESNGVQTEAPVVEAQAPNPQELRERGLLADLQRERERARQAESKLAELTPKLTEAETWREKLTAFETREAEREAKRTEENKQRLAALPEELRELVPDGLSVDALSSHLDRLAKRAQTPAGTVSNGGPAGGVTPEMEAVFDRLNLVSELRTVDYWKRLPENLRK
jgi:DNA repair exonuclease SbcCD ATPase subunit